VKKNSTVIYSHLQFFTYKKYWKSNKNLGLTLTKYHASVSQTLRLLSPSTPIHTMSVIAGFLVVCENKLFKYDVTSTERQELVKTRKIIHRVPRKQQA